MPRWIVPVVGVSVIALVVAMAALFADKPNIFLRGNVKISGELISKARGINTMFIILYDAESPMPMPFGAMRQQVSIEEGFEIKDIILTPERVEVMRPGAPPPKIFRVKVRFDRDGLAGPDQPGDIVGEVARVAYGSTAVNLEAGRVIQ